MANATSDYANFFPAQRKTRLPGGYMGKILRVDMSTGKLTDLNLPEEPTAAQVLGRPAFRRIRAAQRSAAADRSVRPEERHRRHDRSDYRHGFTPGGTKMCFVYLSPATRYTLGRGATSGYFGTSLKAAGYDGIIITGAAQTADLSLHRRRQSRIARRQPCLGQRRARHRRNFASRSRAIRTRASAASARRAKT